MLWCAVCMACDAGTALRAQGWPSNTELYLPAFFFFLFQFQVRVAQSCVAQAGLQFTV